MSKYSKLITLLRDCSDQAQDELQILSNSISDEKKILDDCGINYDCQKDCQKEGIFIDLDKQDFKIFKTRASAVKFLNHEDDFSSDILVIEKTAPGKDLIYENKQSSSELFENILYFDKFKELFVNFDIASHNDEVHKRMTFLSANHGRIDAGYEKIWIENYYERNNDLKNQLEAIQFKIGEDSNFKNFFKESYIESLTSLPDVHTRFAESLTKIEYILETAQRNYELYQHKFSFAEFRKGLNEDKEKYIKDCQASSSDLLSKIAYMPIQYGAYILLIIRFSEELIPISALTILIIAWGIFSYRSLTSILGNVEYLKKKFEQDFSSMLDKSGISEIEVKDDKEEISLNFDKSSSLIKSYRAFVVVFSISAFVICGYLICSLIDKPIDFTLVN